MVVEVRPPSLRSSSWIMVVGVLCFKEIINHFFSITTLGKALVQKYIFYIFYHFRLIVRIFFFLLTF